MGDLNVWYFLFRTGEPVPRFEPWVETIAGTHPRMHEMVRKPARKATRTKRLMCHRVTLSLSFGVMVSLSNHDLPRRRRLPWSRANKADP